MIPAVLAPLLATLASNGLTTLVSAISAKGKEVVEAKLGVDLDAVAATPEGISRLRELEIAHEEFLVTASLKQAEQDLEAEKLAVADRDSARQRDSRVQESANASWLAKNVMHVLALVVVIGGGAVLTSTNEADVRTAIVSLMTMVLGFYFGSSASNRRKDDTIQLLSNRGEK
jgi:hypothetical protein